MTAAHGRAALAAIGCDILALDGGPGERRAAALLDRLHGRDAPAATLEDLADAPDWLRLPRPAQRRVAKAVALLWMGPALANAIDGAWLGRLSDEAGEELLDWAIERAAAMPAGAAALAPGELEAHGFSLLRARLRPSLRVYLAWAPGGLAPEEASRVDALAAAAADAPEPR